MAHVIEQECVSCALCVGACPSASIFETDSQFVIDAALCVDSGHCVPACPVDCIHGPASR